MRKSFLLGKTFVFLGKSGAGKDTQARYLAKLVKSKNIDLLWISTGDLGRKVAEKDTLLGHYVADILKKGYFFPNWLQVGLWFNSLAQHLTEKNTVIFPSSPRLLIEAKQIDQVMSDLQRSMPIPIYIDITDEEAVKRLKKRARNDDTNQAIKERIKNFKRYVLPIIQWYGKRVIKINGMGNKIEVRDRIIKSLNDLF